MKSLFLDEVLVKHDPQAVISLFEGTNEAYRKSVAQRAIDWYRVSQQAMRAKASPWLDNPWMLDAMSDREKKIAAEIKKLQQDLPRQANDANAVEVSRMAVLATCGLTEIRKLGAVGIPEAKHCRPILEARKPKWLDKWMAFACAERATSHWAMVRQMELDGLATANRDSAYWRAFVLSMPDAEASIVHLLEADRELLDNHIWCILDDEPTMTTISNLAAQTESDQWRRDIIRNGFDWQFFRDMSTQRAVAHKSWYYTFLEFASKEILDKERFKEKILYWIARIGSDDQLKAAGTTNDGVPSGIKWFVSVFDAMTLSEDEKLQLMPKLISLLTSKNTEALHWAAARLATYSPEAIPIDDLVVNMGSLFRVKGKDHAIEAIKLLKALCDKRPDDRVKLGCVVLAGLEHPSQDVQKRVLDFIEKQKLGDEKEILEELRYRSNGLSGLLKQRAEKLMGSNASLTSGDSDDHAGGDTSDDETAADGVASSTASVAASGTAGLTSLLESAGAIRGKIREIAGIDDALKALKGEIAFVGALALNAREVPRLDPKNAITPITDIDDLSYKLLHILESGADWEDVEMCLDGMCRLASNRPSDLKERLAPLRKKAVDMLCTTNGTSLTGVSSPFAGGGQYSDLAAICIAWTDKYVIEPQTGLNNPLVGLANFVIGTPWVVHYKAPWGKWTSYGRTDTNTIVAFTCRRFLGVAHQVARANGLQMLSTPTHKGGWIDPRVLVERLIAWDKAKQTPNSPDYIQALLRLAPDNGDDALEAAQSLRGELADSLRFALGGNSSQNMTKAEWWVAAGRARAPRNDFEAMAQRFPGLGPDAAMHAQYSEDISAFSANNRDSGYSVNNIFRVSPEFKPRDLQQFFPTELLHAKNELLVSTAPGLAGVWLQNRESYFASQARMQAAYLDSMSTMLWERSWEPLFDPDASATGFARWCIAIALTGKQPDNARLALDALIACIDECRIDGVIFGDVLAELMLTGRVTLSRWVRAFKDCARVSPLHLQVVRLAVERSLKKLKGTDIATPIKVLELLHDLCLESGENISTKETREYLESLDKKGKTGQLAKLLLELPEGRAGKHRKGAATYALQSRIARAERYKRILEPTRQLASSATLVGDLETASQQISDSVKESLDKTEREI